MVPVATLTIPTRNRCDILRENLRAALRQTVPVEVIVLDDGSTDATPEMMHTEYPQVRYERLAGPNGPCALRNLGAGLASAPILFPLDDDSVMVSPETVEHTLAEFDHPRVGAVAIPFVNVRQDQRVQSRAPDRETIYVCPAFLGASYAIRRDVFLAVGGYREKIFYMTEEHDLCLRLLDRGYVVRLGTTDPIHHHASPIRDAWRARMLERRNNISHAIWQVPFPHFLYHLPGTIFSGLAFGLRHGCLSPTLAGYSQAIKQIPVSWRERSPVRSRTYLLMRRLNRTPVLPLDKIESCLDSLPAGPVAVNPLAARLLNPQR